MKKKVATSLIIRIPKNEKGRSYPPREKESYSLTPIFNQAFGLNPIRAGNSSTRLVFEFHDLFHGKNFFEDFGFQEFRRRW